MWPIGGPRWYSFPHYFVCRVGNLNIRLPSHPDYFKDVFQVHLESIHIRVCMCRVIISDDVRECDLVRLSTAFVLRLTN